MPRYFNGNDNYEWDQHLDLGTTFTASVFVDFDDVTPTSNDRVLHFVQSDDSFATQCQILATNGDVQYVVAYSGTFLVRKTLSATAGLAANVYAHLLVDWDGTTTGGRIFLDGTELAYDALDQDGIGTAPTLDGDLILGSRGTIAGGPDQYHNGRLIEVGIWNRILGTGERQALAAGLSPLGIRNGLRHYVPMTRGAGGVSDRITGTAPTTITGGAAESASWGSGTRTVIPNQPRYYPDAVAGGTTPKGPLGHPLHGPFAGPIAA